MMIENTYTDSKLSIAEIDAMVDDFGPFVKAYGFKTEEIYAGRALVRLPYADHNLRPGGTIAGPAIMALADYAMYVALLGAIGMVPLAVTTNLNINFLQKPADTDLICDARLIKLGKRLAVGDLSIAPDIAAGNGTDTEPKPELCAHATATYSIPPRA